MKRIEEIDMLKGVAMLMVVIAHTSCPILMHDMFYYIHIPMFFVLSGFTCRPDEYYYPWINVRSFVWKRVKTLYFPFLFFALLMTALHNVFYEMDFYDNTYYASDFVKMFAKIILFSVGTDQYMISPLWFMKCLFLCEVLYALFIYVTHRLKISKWIFIGPLVLSALAIKGPAVPQILNTTLLWPLAAIGYYQMGGAFRNVIFNTRINTYVICFLFVLTWVWASYYWPEKFGTSSGLLSLLQFFLTFGAFLTFWNLSHYILKIPILNSLNNSLQYIGRNTIPIYFMHVLGFNITSKMVIVFLDIINQPTNEGYKVPWYVLSIMSPLICLGFYYSYKRIYSGFIYTVDRINKH